MGGINGGVTTFIFPKDNIKDFNDFMDKNGTKDEVKSIVFIPVASIQEVLAIIFAKPQNKTALFLVATATATTTVSFSSTKFHAR